MTLANLPMHQRGMSLAELMVSVTIGLLITLAISTLMLVGEGKLEAGLRELAGSLGIGSRVIFTGFRDDLQACYSAFDIYVNSSVEGGGEAFPFTVLYALAQGLPVIATRVGDVPQMVEENVSGFIVGEKDTDEMSGKLLILVSDTVKRSQMGSAGLELLGRKFTAEKMTHEIEKIYLKVLKG